MVKIERRAGQGPANRRPEGGGRRRRGIQNLMKKRDRRFYVHRRWRCQGGCRTTSMAHDSSRHQEPLRWPACCSTWGAIIDAPMPEFPTRSCCAPRCCLMVPLGRYAWGVSIVSSGSGVWCTEQLPSVSHTRMSVSAHVLPDQSRREYPSKGTLRERCQLETQCNNPTMVTRRKRWRIRIINVEVPDDYYKDIIHERQSCPG